MRIDIMTLFPEMFDNVLDESIIGRACTKGILDIRRHQIRDYTDNKQKQVDDYPFGGGMGCVMMAQPLKSCLDSVLADSEGLNTRVIYLSPQGKPFSQNEAKRLVNDYNHLVLICGHYEGIDERFIEKCVDEEISLGDFVLTGGEIPAMAVADCVCRLVPGVLSDSECFIEESHWNGLLEYPQYTRPNVWEGLKVPDVLLEGDHKKIETWRREQQLKRTSKKRPDMISGLNLTTEEAKLLAQPELHVSYRKAEESDLDNIIEIINYAKESLKKRKIDQWQGEYPSREDFLKDIANDECYVVLNDDEIAAVFVLSTKKESAYDKITDGKWYSDSMDYCVIHRCSVSEKYRGTGMSSEMFRCAENECIKKGYKCIRVDTHKKNKPMQRLLLDSNYKYRGNLILDTEPGHDSARQGYEKIIKNK